MFDQNKIDCPPLDLRGADVDDDGGVGDNGDDEDDGDDDGLQRL